MLPPITIRFADGTEKVVAPKASDGIRFERTYNMPIIKAFGMGEVHMEHLWWFAYTADSRDRDCPEFDAWMDTVESVEFVNEEADVPLDHTVSPGS